VSFSSVFIGHWNSSENEFLKDHHGEFFEMIAAMVQVNEMVPERFDRAMLMVLVELHR
jgi:menaquinone-dependent protoporphyrinogen IX oxidase